VPCGPFEIAFPVQTINMSTSGILVHHAASSKPSKTGELSLTQEILPMQAMVNMQLVPSDEHFVFARYPMRLVRRELTNSPGSSAQEGHLRLAFEFTTIHEDFAAYLHEIAQ
jgi:hypothetical protein